MIHPSILLLIRLKIHLLLQPLILILKYLVKLLVTVMPTHLSIWLNLVSPQAISNILCPRHFPMKKLSSFLLDMIRPMTSINHLEALSQVVPNMISTNM